MVDVLARNYPQLFGDVVCEEIAALVAKGTLPYANLRYSGSGEMTRAHLPGLRAVHDRGVRLWGFTRSVAIAAQLREWGAGVLFSCDRTTNPIVIEHALSLGIGLAYVSADVFDVPPNGTVVTFPIHRGGRVREVVESERCVRRFWTISSSTGDQKGAARLDVPGVISSRRTGGSTMRVVELCAGLGGTRAGLAAEGWETILAFDSSRDAVAAHQATFGDAVEADVRDIEQEDLPAFDVLSAGFPCQPFSSSGIAPDFTTSRERLRSDRPNSGPS